MTQRWWRAIKRAGRGARAGLALSRLVVVRFDRGRSLTGSVPVVVSMTSYGRRLRTVAWALESIRAGAARPARVILWIDDSQWFDAKPAHIRALERVGLEVRLTRDLGPHKKYFPFVELVEGRSPMPLVTADDDVLYGRSWLIDLYAASVKDKTAVIAQRAHRMIVCPDGIRPYRSWGEVVTDAPSYLNFATGVAGVLYPPTMVRELYARGDEFLKTAPRADDVWLHFVAVSSGVRVRQVGPTRASYPELPTIGAISLHSVNVAGNGNDQQIAATYDSKTLTRLLRAAESEGVVQ